MNLVSCKKCGVVLDKNQLQFPDLELEHSYDDVAFWNGCDWIPTVPCPVCGGKIPEKE